MQKYISLFGLERAKQRIKVIDAEINELRQQMANIVKTDLKSMSDSMLYNDMLERINSVLKKERYDLEDAICSSIIIEEMPEYKNFDGSTVILGSEVEIIYDGEVCIYKLLGTYEGDLSNGILSSHAELSKVLIGKSVGKIFEFKNFIVEIVSVKKMA